MKKVSLYGSPSGEIIDTTEEKFREIFYSPKYQGLLKVDENNLVNEEYTIRFADHRIDEVREALSMEYFDVEYEEVVTQTIKGHILAKNAEDAVLRVELGEPAENLEVIDEYIQESLQGVRISE